MMTWIQENLFSLLAGIGLLLFLTLAVTLSAKNKQTGGCGRSCASCTCGKAQAQAAADEKAI